MNKSELVQKLQRKNSDFSNSDIVESIDIILSYISNSLSLGERIEVRGYGSFSVRKRDERIARNPKTGKSIRVEKKYHPYFRASKGLKEILNS